MTRLEEIGEAQVREALKRVNDPDAGRDIVSLGMVGAIVVKGGHVQFALSVDPARGAKLEPLRRAAEKVVGALPGVLSVTAVLTAERQGPQMNPQAARPASIRPGHGTPMRPESPLMPGVKTILAVASGKGGVGKSTTAVNLALAFKAKGLAVGMFDADIFGPSQPRMMGASGVHAAASDSGEKRIAPVQSFGIKIMSMGFLVPEEQPVVWRGPMVMGALEQMMKDVDWGDLDILVVDMPPGTGDTQLTMTQKVPLSGAVIVSTPQDIALLDARKGLNMFRKVEVPVIGIVENMSYYICPKCGDEAHIFGHGGARLEAIKLGTDFLGEVPLDIEIRETSDAGTPIVHSRPESPHAKIYRAIADKVWDKLKPV
jgi:ATP-binding protein involved in chromosome partitioning